MRHGCPLRFQARARPRSVLARPARGALSPGAGRQGRRPVRRPGPRAGLGGRADDDHAAGIAGRRHRRPAPARPHGGSPRVGAGVRRGSRAGARSRGHRPGRGPLRQPDGDPDLHGRSAGVAARRRRDAARLRRRRGRPERLACLSAERPVAAGERGAAARRPLRAVARDAALRLVRPPPGRRVRGTAALAPLDRASRPGSGGQLRGRLLDGRGHPRAQGLGRRTGCSGRRNSLRARPARAKPATGGSASSST